MLSFCAGGNRAGHDAARLVYDESVDQIATTRVSLGAMVIASAIAAATLFWPTKPSSTPEAAASAATLSTPSSTPKAAVSRVPPEVKRALLARAGRIMACPIGLGDENAEAVEDMIARADHAAKNIEAISNELQGLSKNDDPRIKELLDNLDQASADAQDLVATAKKELQHLPTEAPCGAGVR
jgi:hypothetical protein